MQAFRIKSACMKANSGRRVQYTLRQVPAAVDAALREKARREGKSINEATIETLAEGLAAKGEIVHHDLDFLIGSWVEDKEFDKALKDQDRIDPEMWR
jgi:hypothetical protein